MRTGSHSSRHWVGFLREEQWTAPGTVDISSLWKSLELRGLQFRSIGIHKPAEHQQSCNLRKSMFMARPLGSAVVNHAMADAKSWLLGLPSSRLRPYWPARSACSGHFNRRKKLGMPQPCALECSHPVCPSFCWKVRSLGGQYGFGHLVAGH